MNVRQSIEQAALRPIYALLMRMRDLVWQIRRPTLVGVRVLIVHEGRVLLIRHRAGRTPWELPGGGVERFERLEDTARREAAEETGATVRVEHLLGVYDRFAGGVTNYIAVFVATPLSEPSPPRSLEIAEARYFPLDALPDGTGAGTRHRVAEYLAGEHGVSHLW
jgi:8-oxo-dGTP pyrophosphatase MutT (NUDIX family)